MEELPIEQKQYMGKGVAVLHSLTNVAYGTDGWHVLELVRKGLWEDKGSKPDSHGYFVSTYGPIESGKDLIGRLRNRINDAPLTAEYLLDECADAIEALEGALAELTEHYIVLANSGDAGNWDPEKEASVIRARHALASLKE